MDIDLTKVVQESDRPAFKNNRVYTGTLNISGTWARGLNTKTYNITLSKAPDLLDVYLSGGITAFGKPSSASFKAGQGMLYSNTSAVVAPWVASYRMTSPTNLLLYLYSTNDGSSNASINSVNFTYKIIDYSAA